MPWLSEHDVQLDSQGRIIADSEALLPYQTSNPKIFAGGDIVRGSDLVVTAIAEGRKAADGILCYMGVWFIEINWLKWNSTKYDEYSNPK